jgi:hypothetical protein
MTDSATDCNRQARREAASLSCDEGFLLSVLLSVSVLPANWASSLPGHNGWAIVVMFSLHHNETMHWATTLDFSPVISALPSPLICVCKARQGVLIAHAMSRMERVTWADIRLLPVLPAQTLGCVACAYIVILRLAVCLAYMVDGGGQHQRV